MLVPQIKPGTTTSHLFSFYDFLPTALDIAGVDPSQWPATDGISVLPLLRADGSAQRVHEFLYWEFCYYGNASGLLPQTYAAGWAQVKQTQPRATSISWVKDN